MTATQAQQLYVAYFNRPADTLGLAYWTGKPAAQASAAFSTSAEYTATYAGMSNAQIVNAIYLNLFGRPANDLPGLTFWANHLTNGTLSVSNVVTSIASAAQGTDLVAYNNKVTAASAFTAALDTAAEVIAYTGTAANAAAKTWLSGVTTDATLTAATTTTALNASVATVVSVAPPAVAGVPFTLTTGVDAHVGSVGNDVLTGNTAAGLLALTSLDNIDGGAGNDSLSISVTGGAVDLTTAVGAKLNSIENVTVSAVGAVTVNSTGYTGTTTLATSSVGNSTLTAAATTDIIASVASPTGAGAAVINGGKTVTLSSSDASAADAATGNTITVGVTTAAAGAVTVTQSETHAASANGGASAYATGSIRVDGGTTVTVNSLASGAAGDNAADVLTIGTVTVNGKGTATSVSVTQSSATVAYAAAGDLYKVTNGVVAITDNNTATKSDTITSVTLANFGASTVVGNALTTLNLTGGAAAATASGTVGISQSASLTTAAPTTLAINMTSGRVGVITDTNDQYTTVNVASAAAATIGGLDFTNATTLNVSGAGVTTISAQTDLAKVTAITSTGGGLALTGTLAVGTIFTGGAGKDNIDVGVTTKAITAGAGDDTVTISATALGTGGTVDAGDGIDTLSMTAANAVTASATTTFETKISAFEKLSLAAVAATGTVNLANIDDLNDVAVAAVNAGQALTLSGANSGINLRFADATQTSTIVTLASNGSADIANVFLTTADNVSTHAAIDLTGFETINIASADTDTDATLAANAITGLTAADATSVVVTGNAGLALAAGFTGTKVTSFNASGVTAGAVTYSTGALAAAATITGGAGADTLSGASAAIAGVTISGGAGNDIITGSATKASTLNGDAGTDTITGGSAADVIDGGAGTNTYKFSSANVVEQAGSSTTTGVVINLSDAALTQSGVFTATGAYLTTTAPTVAANTSTYLFSTESSTNASVIDTLANINNVTGTNLADYIVGSATANTITGGAGADVLTGGAGADTFVFATLDTLLTVASADIITDFTTATDFISTSKAAGAGTIADGTALANFVAFVAAADAVFTGGAGNDDVYISWNSFATGNAYVAIDEDDSGTFDAGDTLIILTGVNTAAEIALADFL
jgi:S-layer protein